jgi:DNA-binding LacI/PurR family transcriptional regulator
MIVSIIIILILYDLKRKHGGISMKTIMQDIAKAAGVSPGTVSNALNNRKGVSKEKREKILEIAESLGYYKSGGSKEGKNTIRFIIYKKHGFVVTDTPFFSALIEGVERECRSSGYELLVSHIIHSEHSKDNIMGIIRQEEVAGILLLATEMSEGDMEPFKGLSIPVVVVDSYFKKENFDFVLMNNSAGTYRAVSYLIEKGHRDIGILDSSIDINNFYYRRVGFSEALRDNNLDNNNNKCRFLLEPTLEGSYRDMKALLLREELKLPTAFFALNDIIAFGAIRALTEKGFRVPEQISVIGFDDMPFCEISNPRLTTVKVFKQAIGKSAVKRLIQRINEDIDTCQKTELDTELVIRESVQKLNK